jgi:hypothetical protein
MRVVIPDEVLIAASMSEAELKLEIAVWLFQKEKLTQGQASRLAGMSLHQFINPAALGQLSLLHLLYGAVLIPEAVYQEIAVIGAGEPGAANHARCIAYRSYWL